MKEELAAIIILYKPNYKEVYKNILTYARDLKTLYIVGNSLIRDDFLLKLQKLTTIRLLHNGENLGISKAINLALEQANNDNFKWIMTMDQDSSFIKNDFTKLLAYFSKIPNKSKLMIYSPIHNKKFIKDYYQEESFVMTSGNILNIQKALLINGFEEKLFIDEVDHDFCFKTIKNKYIILQDYRIAINHELGTKNKKNITIYKPFRLYYMMRNYLYLREKYKEEQKEFFLKRDKYLQRFFIKHILFSKEKIKSFNMIFLGIKDFRNKKFGKLIYE